MLAESGLRAGSSQFGYWLRRCDGFRVDSPAGRVGFVVELRYGSSSEEPDAIAVRAGRFGRVPLIVPAGEIEEIVPSERASSCSGRPYPRPPDPRDLRPSRDPETGEERWTWSDRFAP